MKLSRLLELLLKEVGVKVDVEDRRIREPHMLSDPELHDIIADAVEQALMREGVGYRAAYAFGEWLSGMITGWATRFNNERDVEALEWAFGRGAFGDELTTVRCYMAPNWKALREHLDRIQKGVKEAYKAALELESG